MLHKRPVLLICPVIAVFFSGCEGPVADEDTAPAISALVAENGLAWNGLAWNGLAFNGLAFNGLSWNGLTFNGLAYNGLSFNGMTYNGLSFNGLSYNGLSDPNVQRLVAYLVSCALPEDDSLTYDIEGQSYTFAGGVGLAPEWKTEACGESCQRWMTACMLARLNAKGDEVEISMRGKHQALKTVKHEVRDYRVREATYYGNFFAAPERIYACHSPEQGGISRVCGPSLEDCPLQVAGSCADACRGSGTHRSFRDCGPAAEIADSTAVYEETITVFLPQ